MKKTTFDAVLTELFHQGKISRLDCMTRKNLLQCGMGAVAASGLAKYYRVDEANECYWIL